MKGLLLKDLYIMIKKYSKMYLLIAVVFIAVFSVSNNNSFFILYPCLLCGMIPASSLSYDEQSRWFQYSAALPYTKTQIVSSKYLLGVFTQVAMLLVIGIAQAVKMKVNGIFQWQDYIVFMLMFFVMTTITSSISLPFMFKLGVEKGRLAYYAMICIVCAGSVVASGLLQADIPMEISLSSILPVLCLLWIGVYALSWYLSIVFFKKREI